MRLLLLVLAVIFLCGFTYGYKNNLQTGKPDLVVTGVATGDIAGFSPVTIGTANGLSLAGQVLSLQAATNSVPGALTAADHTLLSTAVQPSGSITGTSGGLTGTPNISVGSVTASGNYLRNIPSTTGYMFFGSITGYSGSFSVYSDTTSTRIGNEVVLPVQIIVNGVATATFDTSNNVKVGTGGNHVYRCVGGTNDGAINWKSTGPCSGGANTATSLYLN